MNVRVRFVIKATDEVFRASPNVLEGPRVRWFDGKTWSEGSVKRKLYESRAQAAFECGEAFGDLSADARIAFVKIATRAIEPKKVAS